MDRDDSFCKHVKTDEGRGKGTVYKKKSQELFNDRPSEFVFVFYLRATRYPHSACVRGDVRIRSLVDDEPRDDPNPVSRE